jgi:hypothetical protein
MPASRYRMRNARRALACWPGVPEQEAKAVCARDRRECRRPGEHPARSVRPAAPIHDRSSVFPLPGGADTTVTEAGAPSRSNSPERDTTPPTPGRATRPTTASALSADPMTRSLHGASRRGRPDQAARQGRSNPPAGQASAKPAPSHRRFRPRMLAVYRTSHDLSRGNRHDRNRRNPRSRSCRKGSRPVLPHRWQERSHQQQPRS